MLSKKELIRLVFGAVCNLRNQTITRSRFDQLVEELTEGIPGQKERAQDAIEFQVLNIYISYSVPNVKKLYKFKSFQ